MLLNKVRIKDKNAEFVETEQPDNKEKDNTDDDEEKDIPDEEDEITIGMVIVVTTESVDTVDRIQLVQSIFLMYSQFMHKPHCAQTANIYTSDHCTNNIIMDN